MTLEVMSHHPQSKAQLTPLLFVHGAWHGAWCWEKFFLPYFAQQGYESHAMSLRGHGKSEGQAGIRWHSLQDYVSDVAQIVNQLSSPPVVIGHSMGGFVVQKYLENHAVPAAVLLAPIPVSGSLPFFLRYMARHPWQYLKCLLSFSPYKLIETPELSREAFFSADISSEENLTYFGQMQEESFRTALETIWRLPKTKKIKSPILVLAAANDMVFTVKEAQKTAQAYQTEAEVFPSMAHDMMLEPAWQSVADRILAWLTDQGL